GVPGPLEGEEERVSLRVDLAAARVAQLLAQDPAMLAVHVAVAVSELFEQPRRSLDVGEEKGDCAAGEGQSGGSRPRLSSALRPGSSSSLGSSAGSGSPPGSGGSWGCPPPG